MKFPFLSFVKALVPENLFTSGNTPTDLIQNFVNECEKLSVFTCDSIESDENF